MMHSDVSVPRYDVYHCQRCGRAYRLPDLSEIRHPGELQNTEQSGGQIRAAFLQMIRVTEYIGQRLGSKSHLVHEKRP